MENNPEMEAFCDILNRHEKVFDLPLKVSCGNHVFSELERRWDEYLSVLQSEDSLKKYYATAESLVSHIRGAYSAYFKQDILTEIQCISKVIGVVEALTHSYGIVGLDKLFLKSDGDQYCWYRARTSSYSKILSRYDMLHIPFSKRALVRDERYSIYGIPSLYLASSVYNCWEEMCRPNIDSMWVSKFHLLNPSALKVLNLSFTAQDILNGTIVPPEFSFQEQLDSFFILWILQSAVSVVVKDSSTRSFKEEYVIPQMLMRGISDKGIDGILYFSVRNPKIYHAQSSWIFRNLVLLCKDYSSIDSGYSEKMKKLFHVTEPVNLGLVNSGLAQSAVAYIPPETNCARTYSPMIVDQGFAKRYGDTLFYKCELELDSRLWRAHVNGTSIEPNVGDADSYQ